MNDGDHIDLVEDDLAVARRELAASERADGEGRVVDGDDWQRTRELKRMRVRELEELRDEMVAAEESEADLRDGGAA